WRPGGPMSRRCSQGSLYGRPYNDRRGRSSASPGEAIDPGYVLPLRLGEAVIILLDDPEFAVFLAEVPGGHLPGFADGFVNRRRLPTEGAMGPEHCRTAPGNALQGSPRAVSGTPGPAVRPGDQSGCSSSSAAIQGRARYRTATATR